MSLEFHSLPLSALTRFDKKNCKPLKPGQTNRAWPLKYQHHSAIPPATEGQCVCVHAYSTGTTKKHDFILKSCSVCAIISLLYCLAQWFFLQKSQISDCNVCSHSWTLTVWLFYGSQNTVMCDKHPKTSFFFYMLYILISTIWHVVKKTD